MTFAFCVAAASCLLAYHQPSLHHHTQPVNAEDMQAFDTLPDQANLDVRKEARYLAYVWKCVWLNACTLPTGNTARTQGGYQLDS